MRSNASSILVVVFLEKAVVWQGAMLSCHRYSLFLKCISQFPSLLCDALGPLGREMVMRLSRPNQDEWESPYEIWISSLCFCFCLPTSFAPQVKHIMNYLFDSHQLGNERHNAQSIDHVRTPESDGRELRCQKRNAKRSMNHLKKASSASLMRDLFDNRRGCNAMLHYNMLWCAFFLGIFIGSGFSTLLNISGRIRKVGRVGSRVCLML